MFFVDAAHEGGGWRKDLIDEDEDGLLGREFDPFPDHVHKLTHGEVLEIRYSQQSLDKGRVGLESQTYTWYQVLLLVDSGNVRLVRLLADDL